MFEMRDVHEGGQRASSEFSSNLDYRLIRCIFRSICNALIGSLSFDLTNDYIFYCEQIQILWLSYNTC